MSSWREGTLSSPSRLARRSVSLMDRSQGRPKDKPAGIRHVLNSYEREPDHDWTNEEWTTAPAPDHSGSFSAGQVHRCPCGHPHPHPYSSCRGTAELNHLSVNGVSDDRQHVSHRPMQRLHLPRPPAKPTGAAVLHRDTEPASTWTLQRPPSTRKVTTTVAHRRTGSVADGRYHGTRAAIFTGIPPAPVRRRAYLATLATAFAT
jgi:hypothetical protein